MKMSSVLLGGFDMAYPDTNNNTSVKKCETYSLRPRSLRKASEEEDEDKASSAAVKQKQKKPAPLSKYRRKTANARERSRMREINAAFETLRRCVPVHAPAPASSEKLTKITTLRLAMKYISALSSALAQTQAQAAADLQHFFSGAEDLDSLLLESDGESLPLSDHSLATVDFSDNPLMDFPEHSLSPTFPDHSLSPFEPFFSDFT